MTMRTGMTMRMIMKMTLREQTDKSDLEICDLRDTDQIMTIEKNTHKTFSDLQLRDRGQHQRFLRR